MPEFKTERSIDEKLDVLKDQVQQQFSDLKELIMKKLGELSEQVTQMRVRVDYTEENLKSLEKKFESLVTPKDYYISYPTLLRHDEVRANNLRATFSIITPIIISLLSLAGSAIALLLK